MEAVNRLLIKQSWDAAKDNLRIMVELQRSTPRPDLTEEERECRYTDLMDAVDSLVSFVERRGLDK